MWNRTQVLYIHKIHISHQNITFMQQKLNLLIPSWLSHKYHQQSKEPSAQTFHCNGYTCPWSCKLPIKLTRINCCLTKSSCYLNKRLIWLKKETKRTYVSENDFLVFLWRFETAILAANCIKEFNTTSNRQILTKPGNQIHLKPER